jgi:hypothetical protein
MPVVVNEFEVVPAPEQPPAPETALQEAPPESLTPSSLREELERSLRHRERRTARLEAS